MLGNIPHLQHKKINFIPGKLTLMQKVTESNSAGAEEHGVPGLGEMAKPRGTGMQHCGRRDRASRRYMCNICYGTPTNPVLTQCGHLFCWECIYVWSQSVGGCRFCPTCRSRMELGEVIPMASNKSTPKKSKCPPPPVSNRKLVKVVAGGVSINGTRFGNIYLHDDGMDVFSYRTAVGLFSLFCILAAWMLKTHYFGSLL
jgi:E3 ubiquitin-protein ligase RNF5